MNSDQKKFSRRRIIKFIAIGTSIPFLNTFLSNAQEAKASKEEVQYQGSPKGEQQCSKCVQFIPGESPEASGKCQVVEGSISPQGWCSLFTPKQ